MSRAWLYGAGLVAGAAALVIGWGEGLERALRRLVMLPRLPALEMEELPFGYPADLWNQGIEGEAVLRIHITEAGSVDSVALEQSSGRPALDSAAVAGAPRLRYRPAREGDRPVAVWALLPVVFQKPRASAAGEQTP
ncbi:MAG: energy transducer TonB [Gemmatimonadetes bacterium]|nr:energy transducer TonB [Gemmatimonadota bacterium]